MTRPNEVPYLQEIIHTLSEREYELQDEIGKGGYATVFTVRHRRYNEIFCVKVMYLLNDARQTKVMQSYESEINSLMHLEHPHIIPIYNHFSSEHCYYIVLEYCPNGSLHDVIERDHPTGIILQDMMKQILSAMVYCHEQHLCHRDIKPHNILVDKYGRLKLADFGLARMFEKDTSAAKKCGSLFYMAPELVAGLPVLDPFACDVWALGITFYEMYTGHVPWVGRHREQVQQEITTGNITWPRGCDPLVYVLRKMLNIEAQRRAPLSIIQQLPFFKEEQKPRISLASSKGSFVMQSSYAMTLAFSRRQSSALVDKKNTAPGQFKLAKISRKWAKSCACLPDPGVALSEK